MVMQYDVLKNVYQKLLKSSSIPAYELRAFIGIVSWIAEANKDDPIKSHIQGVYHAIKKAKTYTHAELMHSHIHHYIKKYWVSRTPTHRKNIHHPLMSIPTLKTFNKTEGNIISLFSGAMGLDLGFLMNGFNIALAIDKDRQSCETVKHNLPNMHVICDDVTAIHPKELLHTSGLTDVDVLIGGPPCQPVSYAGKKLAFEDVRSKPLRYFLYAINELQPKIFVMEEVGGLLTAKTHKDDPSCKKGSVFDYVINTLKDTGYTFDYRVLNSADYGSPQRRDRVIIIGSKIAKPLFPSATHRQFTPSSSSLIEKRKKLTMWMTLWEAVADLQDKELHYLEPTEKRRAFLNYVPPAGNWRVLPKKLIKKAMGGADLETGGNVGFYRRLPWDEPTPTVLTTPAQKGSMFVHPEDMRYLSIEEWKRLQGFPDEWELQGSLRDQYKQVGNAVPVHLSLAIAQSVKKMMKAYKDRD